MPARDDALQRLRAHSTLALAGTPLGGEVDAAGIRFAAIGGPLEDRWHQALSELDRCVAPLTGPHGVLREGGGYSGTWLESTGTISVDVLTRFAPEIARRTLVQFAEHQRDDGLLPYKVTADGPAFSQIQIVTPLARVVWRHYLRTGRDTAFLRTTFEAMVRYDAWIAEYRDTRGTGAVEAFCTFDTGHDLSPRFWFAPERAFGGDARHCDPDSALLPYVAPDLTANIACQRAHLALIAEELGEDSEPWRDAARSSQDALWQQCFDAADGLFYDRDRRGEPVRIASDVLLRVLACEIGDDEFFESSLRRYLLNTRKFLAHYGFTSIAMDDPRFDHDASRNSWGGPVNFLALLRAPDAFEHHGHVAELADASAAVLAALGAAERFPQCLDPWSGEAGFADGYSPSALWLVDALERWSGVLPREDGTIWFSGATPTRLNLGSAATAVASSRSIDGSLWEFAGDDERIDVHRDGAPAFSFPRGWRVIIDQSGAPIEVVGLGAVPVRGELALGGATLAIEVQPNERVLLAGLRIIDRMPTPFVSPVFS